jgi:hypothetical protein
MPPSPRQPSSPARRRPFRRRWEEIVTVARDELAVQTSSTPVAVGILYHFPGAVLGAMSTALIALIYLVGSLHAMGAGTTVESTLAVGAAKISADVACTIVVAVVVASFAYFQSTLSRLYAAMVAQMKSSIAAGEPYLTLAQGFGVMGAQAFIFGTLGWCVWQLFDEQMETHAAVYRYMGDVFFPLCGIGAAVAKAVGEHAYAEAHSQLRAEAAVRAVEREARAAFGEEPADPPPESPPPPTPWLVASCLAAWVCAAVYEIWDETGGGVEPGAKEGSKSSGDGTEPSLNVFKFVVTVLVALGLSLAEAVNLAASVSPSVDAWARRITTAPLAPPRHIAAGADAPLLG